MIRSLIVARLTAMGYAGCVFACLAVAPVNARVVDLGAINPPHKYAVDLPGNTQEEAANPPFGVRVPWADNNVDGVTLNPSVGISAVPVRSPRRLYQEVFAFASTPKTETWLVSLSVLGLIVIQLRRVQKSLAQHPLA